MITVKEEEFKTPIGVVYRSTLMDSHSSCVLSYECTGGKADSIAGLILDVEKYRNEALAAISEHLKEDTP